MATKNDQLRIYSFGHFSLYFGDVPVEEADGGMNKRWSLFKYLLTNREKAIPGEVITDIFWPRASREKSLHSLYNTIYRLRSALDSDDLPRGSSSMIVIRDGMFSLNRYADYWLDAAEFETLCAQAHASVTTDEEHAIELFQKALHLYKGDYLAENLYDDWVKGAQSAYRNIYKKAVLEYSNLLLNRAAYAEVRRVCERVLELDALDEDIQIRLIESLIAEGDMQEAKTLYGEFSSLLYQESGILPSRRMRTLYQKIQISSGGLAATDFDMIRELLMQKDDASGGAHFCDEDSFQRMYALERKQMSRTGLTAHLLKINLSHSDLSIPTVKEAERSAAALQGLLEQMLRQGDVACRCNDTQFLLVLPAVAKADIGKVMKRIDDRFKESYTGPVILRIREAPL